MERTKTVDQPAIAMERRAELPIAAAEAPLPREDPEMFRFETELSIKINSVVSQEDLDVIESIEDLQKHLIEWALQDLQEDRKLAQIELDDYKQIPIGKMWRKS